MKEKEKIEFKITKLEQLENKNNIYDCEKFIKMLPSS